MGAKVIEKHFTINRNLPGPDQKLSIEPKELKEMIKQIRSFYKMAGKGNILPSREELSARKKFRRSIVASTFVKKGTIFTKKC